MPAAALPPNEHERLRALHSLHILDTPADPALDDLTRQAMEVCATPVALVSLIDGDRQWFKSRFGFKAEETPRGQSFCAHALLTPDRPLIVPDALADARFSDNPLVTSEGGIRFYAGVPLRSPEGHGLGTLCVIDYKPRQLSAEQINKLRGLAQKISLRLILNRQTPAERRLAIGFGAAFALLLGMALYFTVQATHFLASDKWVAHTHMVIRTIESTLFELQAAESSQRGYSASGQEGYLPPYQAALSHLPERLRDLQKDISDNPIQVQRFLRLSAAIDTKLAIMQERIEQRRTLGAEALEPRYLDGRGRRAMEVVVSTGQKMIKLEVWLLSQRAETRANRLRAAIGLLIGTSVLGACLLVAGFVLTRRELRRSHALGGALAQANLGLEGEIAERRRAQQRLSVQHSVAHVAAKNVSMAAAAADFLETVGEHLDWERGEYWKPDPLSGNFCLAEEWHNRSAQSELESSAMDAGTPAKSLVKGEGLAGRVWQEGKPIWHIESSAEGGPCRAFAFPLQGAGETKTAGVVVFMSREPVAPEPELIATMDTLANQIAEFAARCDARASLEASQARFSAFIENAPALAYIKDEEGRMLYGNETLLRTFGLRREQWLGKTDYDFWPEATPAIRENDLQVLTGGKAVELKESVPLPDGTMGHWLSYKFPLRDEHTGRKLVAGISVDITAREHAQEEALVSLREKETLLQEVHHRVKNNLQIIGSLLSMQARRTTSPVALAALGESAGRVRSIALVHEKLYRSVDMEFVDAADYLRTLSRNLMDALGAERLRLQGRVSLEFDLEEGHQIDASVAIACGLILNEALTNSFKHGFPDERSGRVVVALHGIKQPDPPTVHNGRADPASGSRAESRLRLEIRDDGVGLPPGTMTPAGTAQLARNSLGLRLVRDLTKQVAGQLEFMPAESVSGTGLTVRLDFAIGSTRGIV